ncbi:unnamed protein product [Protopolystoma xenopodis]|uniref:Uncharacterized protein n=1 Tax=Protopolystoma xenopodis TaxID=117903 RepID=A0A448WBZ2_9PLAT|nr:unnamed protein product [Protopolystoma xenopodis]
MSRTRSFEVRSDCMANSRYLLDCLQSRPSRSWSDCTRQYNPAYLHVCNEAGIQGHASSKRTLLRGASEPTICRIVTPYKLSGCVSTCRRMPQRTRTRLVSGILGERLASCRASSVAARGAKGKFVGTNLSRS